MAASAAARSRAARVTRSPRTVVRRGCRSVIDAGAARLGFHATAGAVGRRRKPDRPHAPQAGCDPPGNRDGCAAKPPSMDFATVCVNPAWVATCAALLKGTPVGVCSRRRISAGRDARRGQAVRDASGDLRRRARSGHGHQHRRPQVGRPAHGRARHRGRHRAVPGRRRAVSKVIIEAAYLTDEEKITRVLARKGGRR